MDNTLISQFVEAIRLPQDSLATLKHLEPVLDNDGAPLHSSGDSSVVFKMKDSSTGEFYSLICFTEELEDSALTKKIVPFNCLHATMVKYFENEFSIDMGTVRKSRFPVLLVDRVGVEVDEYGVLYSADGKRLLNAQALPFSKKTYEIRKGTKVICDTAFFACESLESITIPNSVTKIGELTFSHCRSLQSITIPNSVTVIKENAFSFCRSLQSIALPNSITQIGDAAFSFCKSLQSITLPNSITQIRDGTFNLCESLQSITIPNSVTKIRDGAFYKCSGLQSITIPNSVTEIGICAFIGVKSLINLSPNFVYEEGVLYNKEKSTILYCSPLKEHFNIPSSVKKIEQWLFSSCGSLQSITIPDSVTEIGKFAFDHCGSLQSIKISNSVTKIEDNTFSFCSKLHSINIPDSVKVIGDRAFCGCSSLKSITIPKSVTKIECCAFKSCISLESIDILNSKCVTKKGAFLWCHLNISRKNELIKRFGNDIFR